VGQSNMRGDSRAPSQAVHRQRFSESPHQTEAAGGFLAHHLHFWAMRIALIGGICLLCYKLSPFAFRGLPAAGLGFLVAMLVLLAELRLRRAEISGLVAGICGVLLGLLASLLITAILSRTSVAEPGRSFLELLSLFALCYLGVTVGSVYGSLFQSVSPAISVNLPNKQPAMKLLDTSTLIDGRIADVCETHFLDGLLAVPRFVLQELQQVADSADGLRRQRGRRGLEVLERIQKMSWLQLQVLDDDVPGVTAVDQKLIDLARRLEAKLVTNDFNLNKVARLQGISVLNVNELANAMKPAVLPGESMRVLISKEGKESSQGVAYLDDGTMVVVDGARRHINRTIDIVVTSTHQTPAGKMIFGRVEDSTETLPPRFTGTREPQASRVIASTRFDPGQETQ